MTRLIQSLTRLSLAKPWATLLILVFITALGGLKLLDIRVDNSLESLVDEDNEVVATFLDDLDRFGGNATLVLVIEAKDILAEPVLQVIDEITTKIEEIPRIRAVTSLTNFTRIVGTEDGLEILPVIEKIPIDDNQKKWLRNYLKTDQTVSGNIVDKDLTATAIIAQFHYNKLNYIYFDQVTDQIREMINEHPEYKFYLAGIPVIISEINRHSMDDLWLLTFGTALMMTLALLVVFRNFSGIFLAHSVVVISVSWTIGLMSALDVPITMASTMLPTLIIIIGISDVIHFLFQYYEESSLTEDKRQCLMNTTARIGPPCLMTSMTTAVGFVSLVVSEILPVRQFGYIAAVGLMMTFLIAFTFVPAVLWYLPRPPKNKKDKLDSMVTGHLLQLVGRFNIRYRGLVLASGLLVLTFSIIGMMRIRAENNNFDFFHEDSPLLAAIKMIDQKFSGGSVVDVIFEGKGPDSLVEPEALRGMADLHAYMKEIPEVLKVFSLSDLVSRINKAMNEDRPEFEKIPDGRPLVAQYLLLFSMAGGDGLESLATEDFSAARVTGRVIEMGSVRQAQIVRDLNNFREQHSNPHYDLVVTGGITLNASLVGYLIESQIKSFGLALAAIFVMFIFLFRSVKIALVALLPNIIPIGMALGLMGWLDIPLNIVTVMIASIAIGIAVDDTIHYISRARLEFAKDGDYDASMDRVLHSVGRAIVFTSVVITLGFGATFLSSFKPPIQFGMLSATTMIAALFGDLIVLPVLLWLFKPFGKNNKSSSKPS